MDNFNNKELRILDIMYKAGLILDEPYDITENMLSAYISIYRRLYSKGNKKLDSSNKRLARKLAGRTLIKHNVMLGAKPSSIKAGMVYLIENPAFPEHCKIGMTHDVVKRLASYQTYDPYRNYSVSHYEFTLDKKYVENELLSMFKVDTVYSGEWVDINVKPQFVSFMETLK